MSSLFLFLAFSLLVLRLNNTIHRMNHGNKTNHAIRWIVIYPVDNIIYLSTEQPASGQGPVSQKPRKLFAQAVIFSSSVSTNKEVHEVPENPCMKRTSAHNRPRSIYQYSSMAPRLSGKNCKFFKVLLSLNSQRRLRYKENNTKYRSLT